MVQPLSWAAAAGAKHARACSPQRKFPFEPLKIGGGIPRSIPHSTRCCGPACGGAVEVKDSRKFAHAFLSSPSSRFHGPRVPCSSWAALCRPSTTPARGEGMGDRGKPRHDEEGFRRATAWFMRGSVRPNWRWGTDLFSRAVPHGFPPFEWGMADRDIADAGETAPVPDLAVLRTAASLWAACNRRCDVPILRAVRVGEADGLVVQV